MLHWLPSALSKHQRLFWSIWLFVLGVHVVIFLIAIVCSRPQPLVVHISKAMFSRNRVVRVLPFLRSTGQLQRVFEPVRSGKGKKRSKISVQKTSKRVPVVTQVEKNKKNVRSLREEAMTYKKKVKDKLKLTKSSKHERENRTLKKSSEKVSTEQKRKDKKLRDKKQKDFIAQHEQDALKKSGESKSSAHEQKPEPVVPKEVGSVKPELVPAPAVADTPVAENQISGQEGPLELTVNVDGAPADGVSDDGPVVLGQEEYELLQAYQALYDQMGQQWRPPANIKPARACIILITINNNGLVEQLKVEQQSGVLAYDVAARMAVNRTQFPKYMWNQQVRLHF